jgi:hypothetical protein
MPDGGIVPVDRDGGEAVDLDAGLGGSVAPTWPGTITEDLAQGPLHVLVSNADTLEVYTFDSSTSQVRIFSFDRRDYSTKWSVAETLQDTFADVYGYGRAVTYQTSAGLGRIELYGADGSLTWSWTDTEGELDNYYTESATASGNRVLAQVINEGFVDGNESIELAIWEDVGGGVVLRRIPFPAGGIYAFTPRGTLVSVLGANLVEKDENDTVLSCPVGFTMIGASHKWMGETTLLDTSEGVVAFGTTCESIQLLVPADDPGFGSVGNAGFDLFTTSNEVSRHVTMWSADGTRIGDTWAVDVPDGGGGPQPLYYQFVPPLRTSNGWSLLVGEISANLALGPVWPRMIGFDRDGTALSRTDFNTDPPFSSTSIRLRAAMADGDGVILLTTDSAGLQLSRFSTSGNGFVLDPGAPMQGGSGGAGGGSGGGECSEPYSETRLADDVQLNSYCQAAYAYWCDGYQPGVMSSCAILTELEAASSCRYCN